MAQNIYLNKLEGISLRRRVANPYVSSSHQSKIDSTISSLQKADPHNKTKITGIASKLVDGATLESNVKQVFQQINAELDHIVFTAGDPLAIKPLESIDMATLKQAGRVHFFAPFFVAKHGRHYLHNNNRSSITFTAGTIV
ncbi:uncharacterized protein Z519_10800 [Cladophialophora bantiana CBS 173.52]|uniref:Uncharacterized protein n=1 Tax=Cladophialophora bantiana (strain ATCC 10958 / CBS 173.52 / CDC B-1940 / NIH 8579) TaxID=1442370 RepID=A0A0D2H5Z3_CLAB1|nr:uncharacterized protein Z519_10800 [Cladophialophora bantiana CBS 173.52]KIW88753.1 hypothetical protein Z519_10800 [Cladophialophora bantiana CBS 173.52]